LFQCLNVKVNYFIIFILWHTETADQ